MQEENILCKERDGGEAPQSWSTSPEDAGGHPGGVLEGAAPVELHCSRLQGLALTQLVEVCLSALRPGDGAHQAGLQERAPAVDEAALPSNIVLPGTKSQDQSSLS